MPDQPIFNRMPFALAALTALIVLAHVARELAPMEVQQQIVETLALFPTRWEQAFAEGDWGAVLPSMFGHVLVHAGWIHLLFNTVLFVAVGRGLAVNLASNARFLIVFLFCSATAALTFVLIDRGSDNPGLGASGAVCGVYSAYLMSARGDWRVSIRDPIVLQNGALFLAMNVGLAFAVRLLGVMPIAWEAHLGGFVGGMVIYPFVAPRLREA